MGYLGKVIREMKQVTWPTSIEINRYTVTVITFVVLFGTYFAGLDFGFSKLIEWISNL